MAPTLPDPIELVPLARLTGTLRAPFVLAGTPAGTRMIFELEGGRVEGERINGSVEGTAGADWLVVGPDGTGTLDVRLLVRTDDDALVFVQYHGRVDLSSGGAGAIYAAPRFDTGDERYAWLNRIQGVAKGAVDGSTLTYDLYEVR